MNIDKLWKTHTFQNCDSCDKKCGKYKYDNLCSNLNYLKNYGEEYYSRMKKTFEELLNITRERIVVFSFGCGCSLDYLALKETFNNNFSYFGIDECEWAVKATNEYKALSENMPKENLKFIDGINLLSVSSNNPVVCFFNSLNDILNNRNYLKEELLSAFSGKTNFYIVCNFTRGGNHVLAWNEERFLKKLCKALRKNYQVKQLEILGGEGIIIIGKRK